MTSDNTPGLSRRTLAKGAAWAVPAVAIASAAPLVAASVSCLTWTLTGTACKWPGAGSNWSYNLGFEVCNTCPTTQTITITSLQNNSKKPLLDCGHGSIVGQIITLGPGSTGNPTCQVTSTFPYKSASSAEKINIYGTVGTSSTVVLLGTVDAPVQDCTGTSPCV